MAQSFWVIGFGAIEGLGKLWAWRTGNRVWGEGFNILAVRRDRFRESVRARGKRPDGSLGLWFRGEGVRFKLCTLYLALPKLQGFGCWPANLTPLCSVSKAIYESLILEVLPMPACFQACGPDLTQIFVLNVFTDS